MGWGRCGVGGGAGLGAVRGWGRFGVGPVRGRGRRSQLPRSPGYREMLPCTAPPGLSPIQSSESGHPSRGSHPTARGAHPA